MAQRLKNKQRIGRQQGILLIMKGVIGALCIVLFASVGVMIENLHDAFSNRISENALRSRVEYGNYALLVDHYHQNAASGAAGNETEKEYYGVAKYYEAASFYKAFSTVGDTERATREKQKMDAAYEEMGGWQIAKEAIDAELGIE
jgi:hypothetical protein